ncbi:hypothetical protein [Pseudomonas graminis]|uniref:Uncharacterized protein n=1 Tax=Pseudomonas graminis TaxID=158627 RepID=A0A1I0G4Q5_9PSED|nr:hypothetical protein [Pseudomonas graminis]SET65819.1 hypothetical protein SAMN05216197_11966 [Pseudomonas graminis]
MRGYTQLIDFMQDLGDGILDHLPEEQRVAILSVEDIVELWMQRKSYLQALSLKKDIVTYAKLDEAGDYSVDQLLDDFDLCFIPERFGCEDHIFLTGILDLINLHIEKKRQGMLVKYFGWLGYQQT